MLNDKPVFPFEEAENRPFKKRSVKAMLNDKRVFPFEEAENRPFKKRFVTPDVNDKARKWAGDSLTRGPYHYDVPIVGKNLKKIKWKLKLALSYIDEALAFGSDLDGKYVKEITDGKDFLNVFLQKARAPNVDAPPEFKEEKRREAATSVFVKQEKGGGGTRIIVKQEKAEATPIVTVKEEQILYPKPAPMLPPLHRERRSMLPHPRGATANDHSISRRGQVDTPLAPEIDPNKQVHPDRRSLVYHPRGVRAGDISITRRRQVDTPLVPERDPKRHVHPQRRSLVYHPRGVPADDHSTTRRGQVDTPLAPEKDPNRLTPKPQVHPERRSMVHHPGGAPAGDHSITRREQVETPFVLEENPKGLTQLTRQEALDIIAALEELGRTPREYNLPGRIRNAPEDTSNNTFHQPMHSTIAADRDNSELSIFLRNKVPNEGRDLPSASHHDFFRRNPEGRKLTKSQKRKLSKSERSKIPKPFICVLCNVECRNIKVHAHSVMHQSLLRSRGIEVPERPRTKKRLVCTLCNVEANDQMGMNRHLSGARHKKTITFASRENCQFNTFVKERII